ncbi:MAG TPA: hypothetical protein VFP72_23695 [Kineosporiaceae bacterium]|nr:hypothetical protein [Kineosporiaceae bacterium]
MTGISGERPVPPSQRPRGRPFLGELQRSKAVPGFAWRQVAWSGQAIGMVTESDPGRLVGVCSYPCMYRTPESLSDRAAAMYLVAHRQSPAHRRML